MGDRAASSWVGILGGGVNDLKTTLRDAIAVESAIVRVEAIRQATARRARQYEIDRLICFVI